MPLRVAVMVVVASGVHRVVVMVVKVFDVPGCPGARVLGVMVVKVSNVTRYPGIRVTSTYQKHLITSNIPGECL
jgi:hypothetical protein